MKLLRYILNAFIFYVIWLVLAGIVTLISFEVNGMRPSGMIAIGGVSAIYVSYKLVKKINNSNLWSRWFD